MSTIPIMRHFLASFKTSSGICLVAALWRDAFKFFMHFQETQFSLIRHRKHEAAIPPEMGVQWIPIRRVSWQGNSGATIDDTLHLAPYCVHEQPLLTVLLQRGKRSSLLKAVQLQVFLVVEKICTSFHFCRHGAPLQAAACKFKVLPPSFCQT